MSVQWQAPQHEGPGKGAARRSKASAPTRRTPAQPPRAPSPFPWLKVLGTLIVAALVVLGVLLFLDRPITDGTTERQDLSADAQEPADGAGDEVTDEAGTDAEDAVDDAAHGHDEDAAGTTAGPGTPAGEDRAAQGATTLDVSSIQSGYLAATAVAVSRQIFPDGNAEELVLIRDEASGDALAAGSLIGLFNTTFLITESDALPEVTAEEVDRLGTPRVHILGGTTAISESIVQQLEAAGHDVHRHSGPVQADTAVDIATRHFPDAQAAVLIRTPDIDAGPVDAIASALAATTLAASQEMPVLLTGSGALTQSTADYLGSSAVKRVIVVGNEEEISTEVTSGLRRLGIDWTRWGGADRFENAVEIAVNRGFATLEDASVVVLVEGGHDSVWPAGMLGAVLAANENGPVLLTSGDELPEPTADYLAEGGSGVQVICTPGVTQQACGQAQRLVGSTSP